MSELRFDFPEDDPLPLQAVNLMRLPSECNVKCEVLQLAVIDSFSRNRIGAKEDQTVLAGTQNQSCRDGQVQFLLSLLCRDRDLLEDAAGGIGMQVDLARAFRRRIGRRRGLKPIRRQAYRLRAHEQRRDRERIQSAGARVDKSVAQFDDRLIEIVQLLRYRRGLIAPARANQPNVGLESSSGQKRRQKGGSQPPARGQRGDPHAVVNERWRSCLAL